MSESSQTQNTSRISGEELLDITWDNKRSSETKKWMYLIRFLPQLRLDKSQQVLLVHACWVMNMSINLPNIVEVPVRCSFLSKQFSIRIDHQVKIKFLTYTWVNISKSQYMHAPYYSVRFTNQPSLRARSGTHPLYDINLSKIYESS